MDEGLSLLMLIALMLVSYPALLFIYWLFFGDKNGDDQLTKEQKKDLEDGGKSWPG